MENTDFSLLLVFSSFIFTTNRLTTCYKKYYIYCFLFFFLTITSLIFHYNTNIYTNILDKTAILSIVSYGGYLLYNKTTTANQNQIVLIVATFLLCIFLFFYGYFFNVYCYHPDKCVGNNYHVALHIISSLGHHLITFL